jgi:hypothetical protein
MWAFWIVVFCYFVQDMSFKKKFLLVSLWGWMPLLFWIYAVYKILTASANAQRELDYQLKTTDLTLSVRSSYSSLYQMLTAPEAQKKV